MNLLSIFKKKEPEALTPEVVEDALEKLLSQPQMNPAAYGGGWLGSGGYAPVVRTIYNGEKNLGELGPVIKYVIDHDNLGRRAWQLYLENEAYATVTDQKGRWVVGTGLRLDCEPKVNVLKMYGIKIDNEFIEKFNNDVEDLWEVYSTTNGIADFSDEVNLHVISDRAERNAVLRGDVLVVLHVDENALVKVQLIDGELVSTPIGLATVGGTDKLVDNFIGYDFVMPNGNRVRGGIEIDDRGQHVAYHVRNGLGLEWDRIEAHDKRGWLRAYMYKSKEYRLDDPRAIPKTVQSMESSKQLDEYTSATVGSAVERQRISYFIQHEKGSEGVDPRAADLAKIIGTGGNMDLPKDINGEQIANTIAVSTNKKTFNLAPGSTIMAPDSKQELHYAEFHGTRFDSIAAASDIPPEVASQKYGGSYSASRAATNGFQYSLNIDRGKLGKGFYQPIFDLQLNMWVLTNKINAPGYIEALAKNNKIVLGAYRHAKWLGDPVPQIDELNEVKAARLKLGKGYDNVPLTTAQKIAHNLGDGNFSANLLQAQRELDEMAKTGIKPAELAAAPDNAKQEDNEEEDQKKKVK